MMSAIEEGDLDVVLHMGLVLTGKFRDLIEIRKQVRAVISAKPPGRLIHAQISSVDLYVVKESQWRRLKELESNGGVRDGNV